MWDQITATYYFSKSAWPFCVCVYVQCYIFQTPFSDSCIHKARGRITLGRTHVSLPCSEYPESTLTFNHILHLLGDYSWGVGRGKGEESRGREEGGKRCRERRKGKKGHRGCPTMDLQTLGLVHSSDNTNTIQTDLLKCPPPLDGLIVQLLLTWSTSCLVRRPTLVPSTDRSQYPHRESKV